MQDLGCWLALVLPVVPLEVAKAGVPPGFAPLEGVVGAPGFAPLEVGAAWKPAPCMLGR